MNHYHIISCEFSGKPSSPEHFHADYELFFVLRGSAALTANGTRYLLQENDFFLINTGWSHSWSGEGNLLTGSVLIDIEHVTMLYQSKPILFSCCSLNLSPEEAETIRKLVYQLFTYSHADEGTGRLMFNGLGYQLLYCLTTDHLAKKNDPMWNIPHSGPQKRTYEILRYVNENYAQSISLGSLSEKLNLTVPYLSKLFKEQFGSTFLSYVQSLRLKHSIHDILYSEKSLTRIAMDNGFPNSAAFIRKFKQEYGLTPSEYRKSVMLPESPLPAVPENAKDSAMHSDIAAIVRAYLDSHSIHPGLTPFSCRESIHVSRNPKSVNANKAFCKPWMKLLHVGNASNLLRYDVREQVRQLHDELHFEYLYIGNLLHPSMNIDIDNTTGKPNFSEIRKVLDYIVSLGMHPYIELETQEPDSFRPIDHHLVEARVHSRLAYLYQNYEFFDQLISFLIRRYGREELSRWKISLERSTAIGNSVSEADYFNYFLSIYNILKQRIPTISIGGPGFTIDFREERMEAFLRNWLASGAMPDFINLYVFPYNMDLQSLQEGRNVASTDRHYLANTLTALSHVMQRLHLSDLETHVTIWNSTLSNRNPLNDSCFKSAYIMNSMLGSWDKCQILGYWNATDISASDTDIRLPLFGGNGLLSQNSLKKPAFHAYRFLNQLYPYYLTGTEHAVITANDHGRFAICCHNYKHYNHMYYQRSENKLKAEDYSLYYEDGENLILTFTISDLPEGDFLIKKRYVSEQAGNIQNSWIKLSKLEELSNYELNYLNAQSEPGLSYTRIPSRNGRIVLEETLAPQEICLILIEQIYD